MATFLPDTAVLDWLQDNSQNEFSAQASIATMYDVYTDLDTAKTGFQDDDRHHVFLTFAKVGNTSFACLLHHLARYPARLGLTTPHDNLWFMTSGVTVGGMHFTVGAPDALFEEVTGYAYTPAKILMELGHDLDATHLTVDDTDLANIDLVSVPRGIWIPNHYAALITDPGLSPVDIWNRVYGQIQQDGNLTACKRLIDYLAYAVGKSTDPNFAISLDTPVMDANLARHRNHILRHLHANAGTSGQSDLNKLIAEMRLQTAALSAAAPAPAASPTASPDALVRKRWSANLDTLLLLSLADDIGDITDVWRNIAASGNKRQERNVLQSAMDQFARSPAAYTNTRFVVPNDLWMSVTNLLFTCGDMDRLDEGIHFFRTTFHSVAKTAKDQMFIDNFDQIDEWTMEDLGIFRTSMKQKWPTTFIQLDTSIKLFGGFMLVLLPALHPLNASLRRFITSWDAQGPGLSNCFRRETDHAQFLRSLQLLTSMYWDSLHRCGTVMEGRALPPPNFCGLLEQLILQQWHCMKPGLPGLPRALAPSPSPAPAPTPAPGPAPTPAPAPGPAPAASVRVVNEHRSPTILQMMEGRENMSLRGVVESAPPPRTSSGAEICLAFHCKGACYSTCRRSGTHRRLPPADEETLCQYVQTNIVDPNIGRDDA